MKEIGIGESDFKEIITKNFYYVDKSLFIKEIIDRGDKVILLPRPRRFGKTLNISMLKYYYDCCPETLSSHIDPNNPNIQSHIPKRIVPGNSYQYLFESLDIWNAGLKYRDKMGQNPVIFLTFKGINDSDWEFCFRNLQLLIQEEFLKHDYLLQPGVLKPQEQDYFRRIIDLTGNYVDYSNSLEKLLKFLYRYYGRQVVILIDEYDAPIHSAFYNGYYEEIIGFMRNFLSGGLKDTGQYLEKSVLTGILRVAKESIFSGLNNLSVYTMLSEEFSDKFGFTENEMERILKDFDLLHKYADIQQWYNGYIFGEVTIYNPWSILNFLAQKGREFSPYWINTSNNEIIESLLSKGGKELNNDLEQLFRDETIEKRIEENIIMGNIESDDDLLWSFLLMGGYLKQTDKRIDPNTDDVYFKLSIPNKEVKVVYKRTIQRYFNNKIENKKLETMLKALMEGNIAVFEEIFSGYVVSAMSFFDTAGDPEKVYHAFVMGLLLWLSSSHEIKSNRESGYGRYDIILIPFDTSQFGIVIEFKKVRKNETVESAMESALKQIEEKKYETELIQRGVSNIKRLAIVFSGKDVYVREA